MRAQDGDVIRRGLGIRGTDADIDQRDPLAAATLQVVGRHLRHLGRFAQVAVGRGDQDVSRPDKARIARRRIAKGLPRIGFEFLHIELVVGEEDKVLEMLGVRGGVVAEPRQRIVDPLCGKGCKVVGAVPVWSCCAVDDIVAIVADPARRRIA